MFKFFGSKYRLAKHYPAPETGLIIEPFAGSAAYSVHHRRNVDRVVLIEKDKRVVDLWDRLLAMPSDAIEALPDPEIGSTSTDLLVAFAAGRTTKDTPESFVVSPRMAQRFRPMVNRIASVVDECRHFEVIEGDYSTAPRIEATWFIDPPYQWQWGRWDRSRGGRYTHPNRLIHFGELATWAQDRPGQVIVCEQSGADWLPFRPLVEARDNTHRVYGEVVWTGHIGRRPNDG